MVKRPGFAAGSRTADGGGSFLKPRSPHIADVNKCRRRITTVRGGQDSPKVECWVRPQGFTALVAFHVFANDQTSSAHANFLKPGQPEMST